jgi:hypothetical protein
MIKKILLALLILVATNSAVYSSFDNEESEIWGNRSNNNNDGPDNNNGGGNGNGQGNGNGNGQGNGNGNGQGNGNGNGQGGGNNGNGIGNGCDDVPISTWPLFLLIPAAVWYINYTEKGKVIITK